MAPPLARRLAGIGLAALVALPAPASPVRAGGEPPSLLLIVIDDVGVEHLDWHPVGALSGPTAPTPQMAAFARQGLVFAEATAHPVCSPSRASLLTGRQPFRCGVPGLVDPGTPPLPLAEVTLAEELSAAGYATGAFGKWHVSNDPENPCEQGFEVFDGTIRNVGTSGGPPCGPGVGCNYFRWPHAIDTASTTATVALDTEYATTSTTNAALQWIGEQERPWFAYVAYNAAHSPLHVPPVSLQGTAQPGETDLVLRFQAMIEALDTEMGRLVRAVDLTTTTVIIVGDNGSPGPVALPPFDTDRAKSTPYEGGIRVPLLVLGRDVDRTVAAGHHVEGQVLKGRVQITDLFATCLALAGRPASTGTDSLTLFHGGAPRWGSTRTWSFSETYSPATAPPAGPHSVLRRALSEQGYKLVQREGQPDSLFHIASDPWELVDLVADGVTPFERSVHRRLRARLARLVGRPPAGLGR